MRSLARERLLALLTTSFGAFAFAACFVPAQRASRIDPMTALRQE